MGCSRVRGASVIRGDPRVFFQFFQGSGVGRGGAPHGDPLVGVGVVVELVSNLLNKRLL